MWRELIERLDAQAVFHPPATVKQLHEVEGALGVTLPADLCSLLRETNGAEVGVRPSVGVVYRGVGPP